MRRAFLPDARRSRLGRVHDPVGAVTPSLQSSFPGFGNPMKKFVRILSAAVVILAAAMPIRCSVLGHSSKWGQPPGLVSGALAACPDKPNCVCSEFEEDAAHYVASLDYSGARAEKAWRDLRQAIEELGGKVAIDNGEYIAATFASSLFGFIDDVECRLDGARNQIQLRSASRVGHSDLGVNRKRIEAITRSFDQRVSRDHGSGDTAESSSGR